MTHLVPLLCTVNAGEYLPTEPGYRPIEFIGVAVIGGVLAVFCECEDGGLLGISLECYSVDSKPFSLLSSDDKEAIRDAVRRAAH